MSGNQKRKGKSIKSTFLDSIKGEKKVLTLLPTKGASFMVISCRVESKWVSHARKVKVSTCRLL